jgi:tetratricopeptide (TPR) repeat protein
MLEEYVLKNSWDPAGLSLHAAAAYLSGDFAKAEQSLSRAIALQPASDRYRARGDALYGLGRGADAAEDYARAGDDPSARCSRGLALEAQGRFEEALEGNEFYAEAHHNLGSLFLQLKRYDQAERQYDVALGCDPDYIDAYIHRARARKALDRKTEAIADVEQSLRLDPGNSRAVELLKELKP